MTAKQLEAADRECLEARAAYILRQSVVEDVLIADPILKAIHSGANASSTEQYVAETCCYPSTNIYIRALCPLLDRRDILGIAHTNLASSLQSLLEKTNDAEAEILRIMEQNRTLTADILEISEKIHVQRAEALADAGLNMHLEQCRAETTIAKKRWRMMKSVVAAVIAGSGVDWASSDVLRDLVIDDEDETN